MVEKLEIQITADDKASNVLKNLGSIAGGALKAGLIGAAGGAVAIGGAILGAMDSSNKWAETLDSMGDVLGTTSEESAALAVAAQSIGAPVDLITNSMAIMTRGLLDAKGEIGPTGTVLNNMGISFLDAAGNIRPTTDILQEVADKLAAMPDGLEKTQLQMDLFGKSGKDVGDMMGILANGGMAAMDEKAKAMGLSMSGPASAGAIAMGRSMNDLKMMGQGLMVTLGTELLPILQPLIEQFMTAAMDALPSVRKAISDAIPVIQEIVKWIAVNLIPVIQDLVAWMIEHVPPAIKTAVAWFTEHMLPAIRGIWEFIKDPLLPILGDIINWLSTAIKVAVFEFSTNIWPKIKTAFDTVVTFIKDPLLPAMRDIGTWLGTTIGNIIETFKTVWEGLKLAFKKVSDFIYEHLTGPDGKLTKIVKFFRDDIAGPINTFVNGALDGLNKAFGILRDILKPIVDFIKWIIDNIGKAVEGVTNFAGDATDWMTEEKKHSNGGGGGAGTGRAGGPHPKFGDNLGGSVVNNWNLTIYAEGVVDPVTSFEMMKAMAGA